MTSPLLSSTDDPVRDPVNILFLAVGHAGGKLISHLPKRVPELSYVAVDTDEESLKSLPFERKILLGASVTSGLGTGGNPELARQCVEEGEDQLYSLFQGVRVVILVAGLGGGTGGAVGAQLADRAREAGLLVIAGLVQPLEAEGGSRRKNAETSLGEYREVCDGVLLFPLESLKVAEDSSMLLARLLKRCGLEIGRALGGLAVLLRSGWLIPLTLQDLVQTLKHSDGYCRLVAVSAEGENRVSHLLDQLFTHPVIDRGSLLAHSGGIVLGILCGPRTSIDDLEKISLEIRRVLRSDADLKIGVAQDERFGQHLALVVMAAEQWKTPGLSSVPGPEIDLASSTPAEIENATDDKGTLVQSEIKLPSNAKNKGRFKGIAPTIVEGADLDTPTFIRKGLRLSFQKDSSS